MKGIADGMALTIKHFFSKPVTVQYPYVKLKLKDRFRGQITLVIDADTKEPRCTGCGLCAKVCPDRLIKVEAVKVDKKRVLEEWQVNLGGCMFCGLCVETCPFGAITMTKIYELAEYDRSSFVYKKERLLKTAVVKAKEPKAAKKEEKSAARPPVAAKPADETEADARPAGEEGAGAKPAGETTAGEGAAVEEKAATPEKPVEAPQRAANPGTADATGERTDSLRPPLPKGEQGRLPEQKENKPEGEDI